MISCKKCKGIFSKAESGMKRGTGCPFCTNQKILVGFNDMWTTNPDLASMLKDPEDGYKYSAGSNVKLDWICPDCKTEILQKSPRYIIDLCGGVLPCKNCGNGVSYPNRLMFNILTELGIDFLPEQSFTWSQRKVYDFVVNADTIIEMHGLQHYEDGFSRSAKEQQKIDKLKYDLAMKNGIKNYIIIDSRVSDVNFIFNNILNSQLSRMFDLSILNIDEIDAKSRKKFLFALTDCLNANGQDVQATAEELKIDISTVYKYIHIAEDLGLLEFDWEESFKRRTVKIFNTFYHNHANPLLCIENGAAFGNTKYFRDNEYSVFNKFISVGAAYKSIQTGRPYCGYTFKHISHEEFNHIKETTPELAFGELFDLSMDRTKIA